jgi:hypothetical protein
MFIRWKIKSITKKLKPMQANRVNNQPKDEILKKEIHYYFELAAIYKKLIGNRKYPFAEIMYVACYRRATELDDTKAHFQLAKILIEEAKYRQNIEEEGVFNSDENLKNCNQLYEEAHAHLLAAIRLGNLDAKRLRGLCLINGWGVAKDDDAGFNLIVESIEQEGSWDKVPQIFASMGLNKPEFFSAIMQKRKS